MDESLRLSIMHGTTVVMMLLVLIAMYFVPTIIGYCRGHKQALAIGALNFLLGWTVLGWIAAFIWSLTSPHPGQTIIIQNSPGSGSLGS